MAMRYHEIVNEIRQWPLDQQLLLLEEMTRLLRVTLAQPAPSAPPTASLLWRGVLASDAPSPTDAELQQAYTEYLMTKYQ